MSARRIRIGVSIALVALGALLLGTRATGEGTGTAYSIELRSTIDPASAAWLGHALNDAADTDAKVAIIRLDTPGGLDVSLREMVKDIIGAPMPVIVYVSPDGARAASAGVFITEAADVAAMAPQTNIGSASPISTTGGDIGGTLGRKITNDAAAFARALADVHHRNGRLAAEMVTEAKNVTAQEALNAGGIDVIASSERDLLQKLEGFRTFGPKSQVLHTSDLAIEHHDTPLQYQLLGVIVNPTIAYLLMLAGIAGITLELLSGFSVILPGVLGTISLILGLYGSAQLPVNLTGVALLVAGVAMLVAEAHLPTHGILGGVGALSIAISGLVLYDTNSSAFGVSAPVVIGIGLVTAGAIALAVQKAVTARHRPVRTGWEQLVGAEGTVRSPVAPLGQVFVEGALWRARGPDEETIEVGARVRVAGVDGLTLIVERPPSASNGAEDATAAADGTTGTTPRPYRAGASSTVNRRAKSSSVRHFLSHHRA
jgi:membrane-bound serine protease (ClpP class)